MVDRVRAQEMEQELQQLRGELLQLQETTKHLERCEELYRAIFETSGTAIVVIDDDTTILIANSNFEHFSGYHREEVESKMSWTAFFAEEDLARMKTYHEQRRIDPASAPGQYECRFICRSGHKRDILLNIDVIPGTGQSVASCIDITARKEIEGSLRQNEQNYRNILESIQEAYYEVDLWGNFTFFNPMAWRGLGYSEEQLKNMNFHAYMDEADAKKVFDTYHQVFLTGEPVTAMEFNAIMVTGERLPVEASVSLRRDSSGNVVGFKGVVRDVRRRKESEKALRLSEERFRDLAELLPETVYEADLDGRITFVNKNGMEHIGFTEEDVRRGLNLNEVLHARELPRLKENLEKMYRGEKTGLSEYTILRKDGSTFSGLAHSAPIMREGRAEGVRGFVVDITEKKKLEARLLHVQRMESIGTLAGGIAHDFNNLLMGILGNISLAVMEVDEGSVLQERLRNMEGYVKRASDLTRQLLGFAQGGKYEVKVTDLSEFIRRSSDMFARTRKEVRVHTLTDREVWPVEIDRAQMEQVMLNLYLNAWEAMPGGGDLYVGVENVELSRSDADACALPEGRYVKIMVRDTGKGMDEQTRARVFDPFFTTRERGRGTGLGLASVYGIMKNHGGYVSVQSEPGVGTEFSLYLPASSRQVERKARKREPLVTGSGCVLLVDDEEMILDVGEEMLSLLGYRVIRAHGGRVALERYAACRDEIDLVVLDMIMPDLGGKEVFEGLKEMDPQVRVLLSSGYTLDGQAKEILNKGCRGFIQKPYRLQDIARKIKEILRGKG
ncbi:MAG TPA: PAS domain S-box protein [Deltaproteobacteria bacterium]|nr:PAS domain S-box protein [Deltaproteobacteria bacterium]HPR53772.1 PAS domain S-box protein [Deltaproteobacteria bacterium]HXK46789.1 PAS domain S-box protein [Deltaproteobacteria bacterium]